MDQQLFRKKSIERVTSPEQLNEYIRVANPSVWIILAAIVILLVGACVWGVFGHLDTTLSTVAVAEEDQVTLYVKEAEIASVEKGMQVQIGENTCLVTGIAPQPISADGSFADYAMHLGGFRAGEWVYPVSVDGELAEGIYSARIVIDSVSPMSFVLN